eukprot:2529156-Prymnesium_polylepis.3
MNARDLGGFPEGARAQMPNPPRDGYPIGYRHMVTRCARSVEPLPARFASFPASRFTARSCHAVSLHVDGVVSGASQLPIRHAC